MDMKTKSGSENQLAELARLGRQMAECSTLPMAAVAGATPILCYVNPAFCRLLGRRSEELLGKPFAETAPEGEACLAVLGRAYRTGAAETWTRPELAQSHPGSWSYVLWPVRDGDERILGVMIQVNETTLFQQQAAAMNQALLLAGIRQQELTEAAEQQAAQLQLEIEERKRAEEALRTANAQLAAADKHKDEFLAMLAHELRNPLSPVRSAVEILRIAGPKDPILLRQREIIDRQITHMARLLDDLLDVSRVTRGKIVLHKQTLHLTDVLARAVETVTPVIESRRHTLTLALPPDSLCIEGDVDRLAQAVGNLLTNAAKYTEEGGRIWLEAGSENGEAVIRVRDTGAGVAPEMLPYVFDLFAQADQTLGRAKGGLGIGLTMVKKLVEMHGGRVEARSAGLGHGSEFIIRLPAHESETPASVQPEELAAHAPVTPRRIMVVDDIEDAADSLAQMLSLAGHEAHAVYDGPRALKMLCDFAPNVVLLDIGMPGMDGYEVARRVRQQENSRKTLLVAVTGYAQESDRDAAREAGFDHHLSKPVDLAALRALLARVTA